jgi:AcrR family transcriptional regulator
MTSKRQFAVNRGGKALNRAAVLRNIMGILLVKGFDGTSITDLAKVTGLSPGSFHKAFGAKRKIAAEAIRFCAESEACLAREPLRTSETGKEAILSMLEENIRLCGRWPRFRCCLFVLNGSVVSMQDTSPADFVSEQRRSLEKYLRTRLAQAVRDGELPRGIRVDAIANLCLVVMGGIGFRVLDGTPKALLFQSVKLFVNALGFSPGKTSIRRA